MSLSLPKLTNYDDHPGDPNWIVFRFAEEQLAAEFANGLEQADIAYERDQTTGPPYLVGVRQRHRESAVRINYTVLGRHREPFIGDLMLRWLVFGLVLAVILLAVIGALLN